MSLGLRRSSRPDTDAWKSVKVEPRGEVKLGFSFRLPQAEIMGLQPRTALEELLALDLEVVRLAALWNRLERSPGEFDPAELDWQVEAAEAAGKQLIIAVGAVKNFGYPELYVPAHHLRVPIGEASVVTPASHRDLLAAALAFVGQVVERYRNRSSLLAWQVEHEAVDPLGLEHSWRLARDFASTEVDLVRGLDPGRPVLLNGFVPMWWPVRWHQRWRTRGQGDSLQLASDLADLTGLDVYPCYALASASRFSLYLDARRNSGRRTLSRTLTAARAAGRRVMVSEGQAEPWETVTDPPNVPGRTSASCPPDRLIENYNACLQTAKQADVRLWAYLFWGAEYWMARKQSGDNRYLDAVKRLAASRRA